MAVRKGSILRTQSLIDNCRANVDRCSGSAAGIQPQFRLHCVAATAALGVICLFSSMVALAATGPTAYWRFDENTGTTTADAMNNGNTGTLVNSPVWTTGIIGNAISFPSATAPTSSVTAGTQADLTNLFTTGMTISAWIKPTSAGGGTRGMVIDKSNGGTNGWFFQLSSSTTMRFGVDQYPTNPTNRDTTATAVTLGVWQHVAATWDGSNNGANIHIYVNGVLVDGASSVGSGTVQSDAAVPVTIGNNGSNIRNFDGPIDEVRVYNRVLSATEIQAIAADTQPPTAPTIPNATASSGSQINLTWSAATDNVGVTGYLIERCSGASCSTFAPLTTTTSSPYTDTGLSTSTSYSYRIRATDAAGLLSSYSTTASATTTSGGGDTTPPTAPSGLAPAVISSSQINLTWTASTDNVGVTGYRVERCAGASCTTFAQIATPSATSYSDTGLTASTSYSYRVRATDAAGNLSGYSAVVSATTSSAADTQPPSNPTNLTSIVAATTISLSWTASTDNVGVTAYLIERCQGVGCTNFAQIATSPTNSYLDSALVAESTYDYRVRATDAAGNLSGYSNTLSSITQDCD